MRLDNAELISYVQKLDLPPFLMPGFLDIIAGQNHWDVLTVKEGNHVLLWFYYKKKKWTLAYITMPLFIKYMGPYFSKNVPAELQSKMLTIIQAKLPNYAYLYQQFYPNFHQTKTLNLPLSISKSMDTYILDILPDEKGLLSNFNNNYRRSIQKYNDEFTLELRQASIAYDLFIESLPDNYPLNFSQEKFVELISYVESKGIGFTAVLTKDDQIISSCFVLINRKTAYYVMAGNKRISGSIYPGIQMIWKVIQKLKKETEIVSIDFQGSSIESIAKVWQKLGAEKIAYQSIESYKNPFYKFLWQLKG